MKESTQEEGDVSTIVRRRAKVFVRWQYIPPEDMNTPLMHIPVQHIIVEMEKSFTPDLVEFQLRELIAGSVELPDEHIRVVDFEPCA